MNVAVIGGGGHGKVIIDILEKMGGMRIAGIVDAVLPLDQQVLGYPVLGRDDDLPRLASDCGIQGVVVAIGDNWRRSRIVAAVQSRCPRIEFPNAIHPRAQLAKNVRLGVGNVIMAGCVVNSDTVIGDFCILNTNCSVDHDGKVGSFASFAPNSCAGGAVESGEFTAVCLGANIIDRLTIGSHTVVGAGATVLRDLPSHVVAYGTPARIVRSRSAEDPYL
ncbi:MAG: acetyltransferase [Thermoguttaceae bacterium]|jgi:sugar O-acyltransferase (sialic acid O-acetyltransferase NeuD family)